jgi:hypothetical protein
MRGTVVFLPVPDDLVNPGRPKPLTCLSVTDPEGGVAVLILEPDDLILLEQACSRRRLGLKKRWTVVLDSNGISNR